MSNVRFMHYNFFANGTFSYSSQLSNSFAASNLAHPSRSLVWRPAGNFEISDSNKYLYINDGTDKTIELTTGSYTFETLRSHIQDVLNTSSTDFTVVYDTGETVGETFKYSIERLSEFTLRLSETTDAVWDTLGFLGTDDITTDETSPLVADEPRNHTAEWFAYDLGLAQTPTFVAVIGPIDNPFPLTSAATVKFQANNVPDWEDPPVDINLPVENQGCFAFLEDFDLLAYRYGRILIIDPLNPLGPEGIELANIFVGYHTTIANTNISRGFTTSLIDPSGIQTSEAGALFFDERPRYTSISSCNIQLLAGEEKLELESLFYSLGVRNPFYIAIDPYERVTQSLGELTYYVVFNQAPLFQHVFKDYYNLSFSLREAF